MASTKWKEVVCGTAPLVFRVAFGYPDLDTTGKKLIEVFGLKAYPVNDSHACHEFVHVM